MKISFLQLQALLHDRFPGASPVFHHHNFTEAPPSLLPGRLVEVVGSTSSLLLRQFCAGQKTALIDGADALDPSSIDSLDLQRLLWVRCHKATEAIRAADLLLRDGNLPIVLLDLRLLPQRELLSLPSSVWHRLRMLAERGNAAVAVFSPCKVVACAAQRWVSDARHSLDSIGIAA